MTIVYCNDRDKKMLPKLPHSSIYVVYACSKFFRTMFSLRCVTV